MRQRGVAVVIRNGRVLLVRDKGKHHFSLPGGAIKKNEPTVSAATRELYEELGLKAIKATRDEIAILKVRSVSTEFA